MEYLFRISAQAPGDGRRAEDYLRLLHMEYWVDNGYEPAFAGYDIIEVNLLDDIPQEAKDALNDPALKRSVEEMPGSNRFKAMVLGLSAFSALRADYDPPEHGQVHPVLPHGEPWE